MTTPTLTTLQKLETIQSVLKEALSVTAEDEMLSGYIHSYIKTPIEEAYSSLRFIITNEEKEECIILIEFLAPTDEVIRVNKILHSNDLGDLSLDCITIAVKGKLPPEDFTADDIINCYEDNDKTEVNISVSVTDNVLNSYYVNFADSILIDTDDLRKITDKVAFEHEDELEIS